MISLYTKSKVISDSWPVCLVFSVIFTVSLRGTREPKILVKMGSCRDSPTPSRFRGHGRPSFHAGASSLVWVDFYTDQVLDQGILGRKPWIPFRGRKLTETAWELRCPADQTGVHSMALVQADVRSRVSQTRLAK